MGRGKVARARSGGHNAPPRASHAARGLAMSGFGSSRGRGGRGGRGAPGSTATPLNPFGLSGGGRASDVDARDPTADPLAKAEGLLGKYARLDASAGPSARPGSARGAPGPRPASASRPASRGKMTTTTDAPAPLAGPRPTTAAGPRPTTSVPSGGEMLVLDDSRDSTPDSVPDDVSISYGDASFEVPDDLDASASISVGDHTLASPPPRREGAAEVMTLAAADDEDDDEIDAFIADDDASASFGGVSAPAGEFSASVEDDSVDVSLDVSADLPFTAGRPESARPGTAGRPGSARPGTAGRPESARPGTAGRPESARPGTAARPSSARPGTAARPSSAKGRSRGQSATDPVPAMAAPWAGAFDGVPVETPFAADDADESAEIIHDEDDASSASSASSDGSVEILHEAAAEAEVGADVSGISGSVSLSGPRSPAVADAEDSTEALHRALAGNDPSSLRDGFASTRPRTSPRASSPAAAAAEDATEELHRALAGNDPIATLRELGDARRRSDASSDSSAEEVATEGAPTPRAGVTRLALDESVASEVATEGRPTPRASTAPRYSETFESEGARDGGGFRRDGGGGEGFRRDGGGGEGFRPDAGPGPGPGPGSPRPPPAFPNLGPVETDEEEAEIRAIAASVRAIRRGEGATGEASRTLRTLLRRVQADAATAGLAAAPLDEGVGVDLAWSSATATTRAPLSFAPSRGVSGEASKPPSAAAAGLAALALADAWPSTRAARPAERGATRLSATDADWTAFIEGRGAYPSRAIERDGPVTSAEGFAGSAGGLFGLPAPEEVASFALNADAIASAVPPHVEWAAALQRKAFDGATRARVAALRARLRTAVRRTEATRIRIPPGRFAERG